ncbi:MAG: ATP-binding protein [Proteobacteria bacterium]|nr:ATP-binding protein [Pseudomonadota bacterium]
MTLAQSVRRFANQLQALHLWIAGTLLIIFAGLFSFTAQRTFLAYQEEIQHDLTSSVSEVRSRLDDIIEYLGFLGAEVLQKNLSEAILNQRAKTLGLHHKELSAIGWIKPHGQITWSFLKDSHEIESSLKKPELIQTLRKAQENQSPIMSPVFRMLNRSKNFAIFVPLQLENHYNGVFFCFISLDEMINSIFPSWLLSRYDISIIDSKNRVLARELVSLNPKLNLTAQSEAISPNLDLRIRLQRYQQIWDWESVLLMALSLGVVMGVAMAVKDLNTDRRQKRELAVQMRFAKDLAEAANRTKTEFVANVSHELRTPLTAIIGNSDLMLRELPYPSCLEHRLQTIAKNSQHLLLLINDLLDHSKIEAGFLDINKKPISILDFMREILIVCQPLAEAKQLKLKIGTMGPIPSIITSDRLRLKQILTNLIGNAIKFTERGSITIRFHSFQDQKDGKIQLECRVDDTGIGIDPLQQDKIFEAFAQANPKITARFGGTGLGLAISRQLAQRLGGDVILLKSELKKGSSFACRLR